MLAVTGPTNGQDYLGEWGSATEHRRQRLRWPGLSSHRRNETDEKIHQAPRTQETGLDPTEVAGDQKDDIVEIGIVVEARDPRLICWAGVGGRREAHDCRHQTKTNELDGDERRGSYATIIHGTSPRVQELYTVR